MLGFTRPVPKNMLEFYYKTYWQSPGPLGLIQKFLYKLFQIRRKRWLEKYLQAGEILDVGSGEGKFSKSLTNKYSITNLDVPKAAIKNPTVIKRDFIKWRIKQKFDAVVFWESLEHTQNSTAYIKKASLILKSSGFIMIEFPRFNSWESRLFSKYWFHLDPPRHLTHLTLEGLMKILKKNKLQLVSFQSVIAPEYSLGGFASCIMALLRLSPQDLFKKNISLIYLVVISPLMLLAIPWQIFLYLVNQSPIGVIIAKKE
ncbi:class I SAM-dependent methyltransferase [Candidatus Daviesbacteria bacterium]|nr:class I SAM-dependent methyltransferase [Candidatus Daviesbacteria bacterium]